jgi:UDP-glucose 4-epimerase
LASGLANREVTIYGDGHAVRDYVHVHDIAAAITHLVEYGTPGDTYNVGTGMGVSVRQLIDDYVSTSLAADGIELTVSYHASRRADVEYNVLDSSRLTGLTGWVPSIALGDGIAEVLSWLKAEYKFN